jgi:hypothetical protein
MRMLRHDEIRAPTNIDDPAYGANEHSDSGFVDTGQMAGGDEQIAENQ